MNEHKDQLVEKLNELRSDAIEVFSGQVRELSKDKTLDGHDVLTGAVAKALDHAIVGQLNMVYERPEFFVDRIGLGKENEEITVECQFTEGLGEYYLKQVSN